MDALASRLSAGTCSASSDADWTAASAASNSARASAAIRAGLDWSQIPVHQGDDSTIAQGEAGAETVLATTPRSTALLCLSGRLAEGAMRTATRLGLRVPEDL